MYIYIYTYDIGNTQEGGGEHRWVAEREVVSPHALALSRALNPSPSTPTVSTVGTDFPGNFPGEPTRSQEASSLSDSVMRSSVSCPQPHPLNKYRGIAEWEVGSPHGASEEAVPRDHEPCLRV